MSAGARTPAPYPGGGGCGCPCRTGKLGRLAVHVYLDTVPVIYLVEEVPNYAELVDRRVSVADVIQVASDLTRMECWVKPLREGNTALLQDYDDYFAGVVEDTVVLTRAVIASSHE